MWELVSKKKPHFWAILTHFHDDGFGDCIYPDSDDWLTLYFLDEDLH